MLIRVGVVLTCLVFATIAGGFAAEAQCNGNMNVTGYFTPGEELFDIVGVRYKFNVVVNEQIGAGLKILFGFMRLFGSDPATYLLENNLYTTGRIYSDHTCTSWPLLGTIVASEASLRMAVPDYIELGRTGAKTFDAVTFPRQSYNIDGGPIEKTDMISQLNLNATTGQITILRGGIITDKTGWKCVGDLDDTDYRQWDATVSVSGSDYRLAYALPDANAKYLLPFEFINFRTEFFLNTGDFQVLVWDFQILREGSAVWIPHKQFIIGDHCGDLSRYGSRLADFDGERVIEISNVGGGDYLPLGTVFSTAACGDGSLDPGEDCDDDNLNDGDGCDADCFVETCFSCDDSEPSTCTPIAMCVHDHDPLQLCLSTRSGVWLDGIRYQDDDIICYDFATTQWSLHFDGSDVGLRSGDLDAFHIQEDDSILLSLNRPKRIPGLGRVDDSDIIRFVPTSLGSNTVGRFEWYFDGSDVGLTRPGEDIDAISQTPDGRLLISTIGSNRVNGIDGKSGDEDLLVFNHVRLGADTQGSFELYFDGSNVGLSDNTEDVDAGHVDPYNGYLYLNTRGDFEASSHNALSGNGLDIFSCDPTSLGANTACRLMLFFQGLEEGLRGEEIDALWIKFSDEPVPIADLAITKPQ